MKKIKFIRHVSLGLILAGVLMVLSSFSISSKANFDKSTTDELKSLLYNPVVLIHQQYSKSGVIKTALAPFSISTNTWNGSYIRIIFSRAGEQPITFYPTSNNYSDYVPEGTYDHVYFETVKDPNITAYMAFGTNGSGTQQCVAVTDEWIDLPNVTIDGTINTFIIGDYCNY